MVEKKSTNKKREGRDKQFSCKNSLLFSSKHKIQAPNCGSRRSHSKLKLKKKSDHLLLLKGHILEK